MFFRGWTTDMVYTRLVVISLCVFSVLLVVSCSEENPPREEIPLVKDALARLELAVKSKNLAGIDSLLVPETRRLGYSAGQIAVDVYLDTVDGSFYTFGKREFFYTKDKATVSCRVMADSGDTGRAAEITLVNKRDQWLVKRFDLR
jgi:hypothetical protein